MLRNQKGFTIMELMIVIVIIGVLAAIGVPAYKSMTDRARKTACEANQRTIFTAVAMYYAEHGDYAVVADTTASSNAYQSYLDNITSIVCPGKTATGGYAVDVNGKVTCMDVAGHN